MFSRCYLQYYITPFYAEQIRTQIKMQDSGNVRPESVGSPRSPFGVPQIMKIESKKPQGETCKLCSLQQQNPSNEIITPCGCGYRAHRECIKKYLIQKRLSKCPYCSNDFLVGFTFGSRITCAHKLLLRKCLLTLILSIVSGAILSLSINILITFVKVNNKGRTKAWETVILVLVATALVALIAYIIVLIYAYCIKKQIVDIELYCSKTEIAKGMEDPQKSLKKFFEWLQSGGYYEKLKQDFPELKVLLRKKSKKLPEKCGTKEISRQQKEERELANLKIEGFSKALEDPNEAVIYSFHNSKRADAFEEIKQNNPIETNERMNFSRHEIIEENKEERIPANKEIVLDEIVMMQQRQQQDPRRKETDTVISVTDEVKSGEVNVANHVLEVRKNLGKPKGDAIDDNIITSGRKQGNANIIKQYYINYYSIVFYNSLIIWS
eukprot:TRINITY_DN2280_c0_g1_i1.p2 TRINITY_DN2280_c0_g1~~TRINITY_DN2280_c0_g1_i1.p2  ORF type:complete len:438 (-),score=30.58 TRINITY_DN2280_c0_g1_i1:1892-3205(-)